MGGPGSIYWQGKSVKTYVHTGCSAHPVYHDRYSVGVIGFRFTEGYGLIFKIVHATLYHFIFSISFYLSVRWTDFYYNNLQATGP